MKPLVFTLASFFLVLPSCTTSQDSTSQGAIAAAVGAAGGAGIAAATGRSPLVGAAIGAVVGAGAGVAIAEANKGPIEGDVREGVCTRREVQPGAAVAGQSGAVWADLDGDGCVDGYVSQGRYYQDVSRG